MNVKTDLTMMNPLITEPTFFVACTERFRMCFRFNFSSRDSNGLSMLDDTFCAGVSASVHSSNFRSTMKNIAFNLRNYVWQIEGVPWFAQLQFYKELIYRMFINSTFNLEILHSIYVTTPPQQKTKSSTHNQEGII